MRTRLLLAAVLLLAGCSDRARSSAPDVEGETQLDALERETGAHWEMATHARLGTPALLAGRTAPLLAGSTPEKATLRFLADHRALFRMTDPEQELTLVRSEIDERGFAHARFAQRYAGLRVQGGELLAHFAPDGALTAIRARYVPGLASIDRTPAIDARAAIAAATADVAREREGERDAIDRPQIDAASRAELVIFVDDEGAASLAYRVHVRGQTTVRVEYTVDAHTGALLQKYDDIQTVSGSGIGVLGDTKQLQVAATGASFTLSDTTRTPQGITTYTASTGTTTPGDLVTSATATTWDATGVGKGAAVDAHFYAGVVYDFYKNVFQRKGIDGNDSEIVSTVHFQSRYDNAFWDGTQMVYGDGDGTSFRAFSGSLDVIGHELTHGVTQSTSQLEYVNQSGALNEAVSDIFGTFVEHSYKDDPTTNWILGEGISLSGTPIRDMIHPANGQQPANVSQLVKTSQDNGGVHINSGIVNNTMFLMTMGGTNDASKIAVAAGLGWDRSAALWYRAAFHYFGATTDFAGAAQDTLLAAGDLGFSANETAIVECAWIATGVLPGPCKTIVASVDAGAPAVDAGAPPSSGAPAPSASEDAGSGGASDSPGASADPGTGSTPAPTRRTYARPAAAAAGCAAAPGTAGEASEAAFALVLAMGAAAVARRRARARR